MSQFPAGSCILGGIEAFRVDKLFQGTDAVLVHTHAVDGGELI
jgi:hypothetical protein